MTGLLTLNTTSCIYFIYAHLNCSYSFHFFQAIINFPKYCEPLEDNKNSDVRKLWRNIEPKLKKCLSTVYMREVTTGKDEIENENVSMSGINQ